MIVVGVTIGLLIMLTLAIAGAVLTHLLAPVRLNLPDDLEPYVGDQPSVPYAAERSPAERLFVRQSPAAVAVVGAADGGNVGPCAVVRSPEARP